MQSSEDSSDSDAAMMRARERTREKDEAYLRNYALESSEFPSMFAPGVGTSHATGAAAHVNNCSSCSDVAKSRPPGYRVPARKSRGY